MKKKRILQAVSILLALLFLPACHSKEDSQISEQASSEILTGQHRALEANEILMKHVDEFSKHYGGVYIEGNILHIQLTKTSSNAARKIERLLSEYKDCISIDKVDYSYNRLYNHVQSIVKSFDAVGPHFVTGWGVDIVENTGVITVANEEVATKLTQFLSKKSSKIPVEIKIESAIVF